MQKPILLCILDGWGVKRGGKHDAISQAKTPNFNELLKHYPNSVVETSGLAVGLPDGQMGNSEVGHMNIGSGRVVMQTLPKIDAAIKNGELKNNKNVQEQISILKNNGHTLHLMGLVSNGGVHAHEEHIIYLAKLYAESGVNVKIHIFTDGRDTAPNSAVDFVGKLARNVGGIERISIASICGRYYAMDRDRRWDRVEKAYDAIVLGSQFSVLSFEKPVQAIEESYKKELNDEFILPMVNKNYHGMKDGDGILMANFRADRARQLLDALTASDFVNFNRKKVVKFSSKLGMVEYSENLNKKMKVIFPSEVVKNTLGEIVAGRGMKQLRIAETEKYAHVTFFFNGGAEEVFEGEERIMVQSPKVATYDLQPEMSAFEVTNKLIAAIQNNKFDLIVCNYANGDMVGHTGIMPAAIKAVEALDACLGKLKIAIEKAGGVMVVSADHGNVEEMVDDNGLSHTQHTVGPVPFILVNYNKKVSLDNGRLCDIAPTLLEVMGLPKPKEMNGVSLING